VFPEKSTTPKDISTAGEQVLINVYNGTVEESLNSLYYKHFCEKVATNAVYIHPQTLLPPTSAAAKYHSLHVYLQVQKWKGCSAEVQPLEWGWKMSEGKQMPVLTDLPPAPDELLKIIRCNCHTDCSSLRCTCEKHNVRCSTACGNCRRLGCTNSDNLEDEYSKVS